MEMRFAVMNAGKSEREANGFWAIEGYENMAAAFLGDDVERDAGGFLVTRRMLAMFRKQ